MKSSNSKQKKDSKNKSISKDKNNLKTIDVEPSSKFKNELFQKLFDNNIIIYKERVNTHGSSRRSKKNRRSPHSTKINQKIIYNNRNPSYYENLSKSRVKLPNTNSKTENNTYSNINSAYVIKTKKASRSKNSRKLKDYPNLIKGVLNQINYYNLNNNINYNENIRYKPIDDFFNEQSSIFIKNIIDNNANSPNTSINLDFKQEQKSENQSNNNIFSNPKNNNDNNPNLHKMKSNEEDDSLEQDIKSNRIRYRRSKGKNNIKNISPIPPPKEKNIYKNYLNDLNFDIDSDNNFDKNLKNLNDINAKQNTIDNNEIIVNDDTSERNRNIVKNGTPNNYSFNIDNMENEENNTLKVEKDEINKIKFELIIEKINSFEIYNNKNILIKNFEQTPSYYFSIENNIKKEIKENNNFNNLEIISLPLINYIGEKKNYINNNNNEEKIYEDNNGKLIFNNDDEVLKYIKRKIREDKDIQYNNKKMKYNYFTLVKIFHGKKLYEIGLENNLVQINDILDKENVEIEHEPVMFINKKDLIKYKNGNEIPINNNNNEELEKLNNEKQNLIKENEKLKKHIESINKIKEKNIDKNNENEYNNLLENIEKLDNENKEKQNMLNEYKNKISEYNKIIESYNILQAEKEKYTKYIIELQEYNEKIIIEYNKMKTQLESELKKNNNNNSNLKNNFNQDELNIISVELFDILKNNQKNFNKGTDNEIKNEETSGKNNYKNNDENKNRKNILSEPKITKKMNIIKETKNINDNNNKNDEIEINNDNNITNDNNNFTREELDEDKAINNKEEIIMDNNLNIDNEDKKINNNEDIIIDNDININTQNNENEKNNENYEINKNIKDDNKSHTNKVHFENDNENIKNELRKTSPNSKKDESMNRALQRIKNKKLIDEKNNKEKKAIRKSERITGIAKLLEEKLNQNPKYPQIYDINDEDDYNQNNEEY